MDPLARALEEKTRRLAAERLELAVRMERDLEELRADCDRRLAVERARAERLEAELAEARAALAELSGSGAPALSAQVRRAYQRLRSRR